MAVTAFVVSVLVAGLVLAGGGYLLSRSSREASDTHDAICALSSDLEARAEGARRFLEDHPHGIPGIPAATIREGLTNQERSIDALSVVSC